MLKIWRFECLKRGRVLQVMPRYLFLGLRQLESRLSVCLRLHLVNESSRVIEINKRNRRVLNDLLVARVNHVFLLYLSKTRCDTELWLPYRVIKSKSTVIRCFRLASTMTWCRSRPATYLQGSINHCIKELKPASFILHHVRVPRKTIMMHLKCLLAKSRKHTPLASWAAFLEQVHWSNIPKICVCVIMSAGGCLYMYMEVYICIHAHTHTHTQVCIHT